MTIEALKPQDIFVAAALVVGGERHLSHAALAATLHVSPSTVYDALKRLRQAKLTTTSDHGAAVVKSRFLEFLVYAVPTLYFPKKIEVVRGLPTAMWSPQFRDKVAPGRDIISVWPYTKGKELGEGLVPIYPTIPIACSQNLELYQFMGAVEVLRIGRAKEKDVATTYLKGILEENTENYLEAS